MSFTLFCSWFVITIIAGLISGGLGYIMADFEEDGFTAAWLISTVMLGVCAAYIMYSKGIIS